jgi:hypothetical protein
MFQHLADRIWARIEGAGGGGHGASPLMWALLACPGPLEPTPKQEADWNRAFESYYERIQLLGRSPLKYLLVKRRYQTSLNVRDFLPFSGIQTWAWGEEPPIIHPTRLAPSTTQAWGLDTARQGVSYSWGLFGAGAMVPDFKFRLAEMPGAPSYALSRYDQLWRLTLFTEVSTVILEWGHHGPRRTFWTLNRLAPAAPRIEKGVVHFAGRRARLYSTVPRPQVHEREDPDSSGALRVLEYACGESAAAFAFSDESFAFGPGIPPDGRALVFTDSSGHYEVTLPDRLLSGPNPGQCSISTGELFWKIRVIHSAELRP